MEQSLRIAAQQLLGETIQAYNVNTLSIGRRLGGLYEHNGKRCAIGRIMTDEALKMITTEAKGESQNVEQLLQRYGSMIIIDKWKPLAEDHDGRKFLMRLQAFHDMADNWNELGVSSNGAVKALEIMQGVYHMEPSFV